MITVDPADVVPMDQFPLAWRFTDERWDARRGGLRADLHPLRPARARELAPRLAEACAVHHLDEGRPDVHIAAPCESAADVVRTRDTLAGLPIGADERIIVSWEPTVALETSWQHVHDAVAGLLLSRHGRRHDQPARRGLGALLPPLGSVLVHGARERSDRLTGRGAARASIATAAPAGCRRLRARPPAGRPSRRRSAPCSRSASGCSGRRPWRRRGRNGGGGR